MSEFTCPKCKGKKFSRDSDAAGQTTDTVRCHAESCGWSGRWSLQIVGLPFIRTTRANKAALMRAAGASGQKLGQYILNEATNSAIIQALPPNPALPNLPPATGDRIAAKIKAQIEKEPRCPRCKYLGEGVIGCDDRAYCANCDYPL